jgi:predicted neuraminidase
MSLNMNNRFANFNLRQHWLALAFVPMTISVVVSHAHAQTVAPAVSTSTETLVSQFVFPLNSQHNHAPGIVEFPNGDLLVSWYRGAGERKADDVAVLGSWKRSGSQEWSEPFVMADQPGFPDCNTCMHVDTEGKLWLFWPTIIANSWESCLTRYRMATPAGLRETGAPKWESEGLVLLKPEDFSAEAEATFTQLIKERVPQPLPAGLQTEFENAKKLLKEKLYQRLGWQPRCKPTVLPSGRILLPLYTDTFSISIMAISDDGGKSWYASRPIYGLGNIQPAVLRRDDGTLVAYMRDNGPANRIQVSQSQDDGITWSVSQSHEILNPGSGLDAVRLRNGHWVLLANDTLDGRNKLTLFLSDDEGRTWKWRRSVEDHEKGSYHYPCLIQGKDDSLHLVYSYFVDEGKTMKYVQVPESWIKDTNE